MGVSGGLGTFPSLGQVHLKVLQDSGSTRDAETVATVRPASQSSSIIYFPHFAGTR